MSDDIEMNRVLRMKKEEEEKRERRRKERKSSRKPSSENLPAVKTESFCSSTTITLNRRNGESIHGRTE